MNLYLSSRKSARVPLFAAVVVIALAGEVFSAGTFVTAIPGKPDTLDPAGTYDRYGNMIELSLYDPLVAFAGNDLRSGFVPALSTKVPSKDNGLISRDGLTYSFPIRKNVRFHDGSLLTAGDAAYSFIRFMLTDVPFGPSSLFLKPVLGISSVRDSDGNIITSAFSELTRAVKADGDMLVITLKKPFPPFLALLASKPFITSQAWAAAHGEWDGSETSWKQFSGHPASSSRIRYLGNGTGPFKFESMEPESGQITLVRNENYWRKPASLDRLVFAPVASESSRLSMLEVGDVDYAEFDPSSLRDLSIMKDVAVEKGTRAKSLVLALSFNFKIAMEKNPFIGSGALDGKGIPADFFSNIDVRKGFAYALNYPRLLSILWRSNAKRITSPIPRPDAPVHSPFQFDAKKAELYFRKAFGGELWKKGFDFTYAYIISEDSSQEEAVKIFADGLKKINPLFIIRTQPVLAEDYRTQGLQQRLPLYLSGFAQDYPDYYSYAFTMMHSLGAVPKLQGYSNTKADALCEEILLKEGKETVKLLSALDAIYAEDIPYILLFASDNFKAFRKGITGVSSGNLLFSMNNYVDYYGITKP